MASTRNVSAGRGRFPFSFFSTPPAAITLASALVLTGCQANPEDPPAVDPASTSRSTTPPAQPRPKELREITVGVDPFTTNLNPHVVGNHDPVVAAVADLTLPSVFVSGSDGKVLDSSFVTDVKTDDAEAPTKVTYTLNPAAQWSDGTPITTSDFQYLASAIASEPTAKAKNVYDHVASVRDGSGAGEVEVRFDKPFTAWKDLFQHLLPSHIYQAEGRSFASMMEANSAASAGAYAVRGVNEGRGIIELQRNDRYWGQQPAKTDIIRFSAVPSKFTGAQMLRTEQIQAYLTRPNATTKLTFDQLDGVQTRSTSREVQLNLVVNQASERMADKAERQKVLAALDRDVIAEIVEGNTSAEAPSWDVSPELGAGVQGGAASGGEGVVLGAPTDDVAAIIAARTAADQLNRAGIGARVRTAESAELFGTLLPEGSVDGVVTWQNSPNSAADYMEQFQCLGEAGAKRPGGSAGATGSATASTPTSASASAARPASTVSSESSSAPSSESIAASTMAGRSGGGDGVASKKDGDREVPQGGNLGAVCSKTIDRTIAKVATGEESLETAAEELDAAIAAEATVLAILADNAAVAVSDILAGPSAKLASWPMDDESGILVSAPTWRLTAKPGRNATGEATDTDDVAGNTNDTLTDTDGTAGAAPEPVGE